MWWTSKQKHPHVQSVYKIKRPISSVVDRFTNSIRPSTFFQQTLFPSNNTPAPNPFWSFLPIINDVLDSNSLLLHWCEEFPTNGDNSTPKFIPVRLQLQWDLSQFATVLTISNQGDGLAQPSQLLLLGTTKSSLFKNDSFRIGRYTSNFAHINNTYQNYSIFLPSYNCF